MRYYYTPDGLERLRARIARARAEYKAVCDDNPAALESGDTSGWHDNFAFEENQRKMHMLANRVRELERRHEAAVLVPPLEEAPDRVVVGASVRFAFEDEEEAPREVWIAGYDDGDPSEGRISYNSPLGKALIGAEPGDLREVRMGPRTRWLEVLAVGPTPRRRGEGAA